MYNSLLNSYFAYKFFISDIHSLHLLWSFLTIQPTKAAQRESSFHPTLTTSMSLSSPFSITIMQYFLYSNKMRNGMLRRLVDA